MIAQMLFFVLAAVTSPLSVVCTDDRRPELSAALMVDVGMARVRLPKNMLPIARGGKDGWFEMKKVTVRDGSVFGKAAVNPLNNPQVSFDRVSSRLSINGQMKSFYGSCVEATSTN